ncbi:MAG: DNA-directed RNA polymerase subunit alpha [Chloroflexi bacterium]|nr:DNA-directed RNA polymerase subunit alpha [Chloroflexota bacterium]MBA3739983.1 DNA-directed RNA polymerase subunit alpha [Chloroflexota bacterium]
MIELEIPQQPQAPDPHIEEVHADGNLSRFEVTPLQEGYGMTLGNGLRRVLLSSLEGAAVTSVQINGVFHEFSTIENVKEDVTQIVLNIKKLRLRSFARHAVTLKLIKHGAGPVTGADIGETADVEIVNPDLVLLTLDSDSGSIEMDLTVENGMGYRPAEHTEDMTIGVVPVDAIFSPVRRVNYQVEKTRVGQMTNYDKLTVEIETDGTKTAQEALSQAADILVREFGRFAEIGRQSIAGGDSIASSTPSANLLDAPIEELDLPMRAYNSLKRNSITKIGQVLSLSDDEFLRMRNFGQKSLDELKERLALRGFIASDATSMSSDESDLPASAELDEAAVAEMDREA